MTTFADLFSSLKDELAARYRSPVWGAFIIALVVIHWKIIVFFLTEKQSARNAISFIEENVSGMSITEAIAFALCYVIIFPWVELIITRAASFGKRARNDFHTEEREREIGRRKLIAQQQTQLIEIELKNKSDQSKLADIELVRAYQNILSGEHFGRWLKDIQNGAINSNLNNSISSYLNKVDSIEGKFINPEVELAHANFVSDLSSLGSILSDGRAQSLSNHTNKEKNNDAILEELKKFSLNASESLQKYRRLVRELLGV